MQQLYEYRSSRLEARRQRIARLRQQIAQRQQQVTAAQQTLRTKADTSEQRQAQLRELEQDISVQLARHVRAEEDAQAQKLAAFQRLLEALRKDREILCDALCGVVGLQLEASEDEFAVLADGVCLFGLPWPGAEGWDKYPREYIDACVGHCVHVLSVLAHYYHASLPFRIVKRGAQLLIRPHWRAADAGEAPLSAVDTELPAFIVGLAMLFYNIAYLCYCQGVELPPERATHAVENLRLAVLGTSIPLTSAEPAGNRSAFAIDVYDIVTQTMQLYSDGPDLELRQQVHSVLRSLHLCDDAVDSVDYDDENWAII
ncbi:hypothetical protein LPJ57_000837 [Coemansia sp. RSA 486]|nr:hypothetical protein LPJ57_000837 [Coemansia sp. RSA 486]KAJ2235287.1 hypothetical protein IWW45_002734 [Coemansia sp. RSA 485]KAJ2600676.1 hypothetical protein GGF39_001642 [Coemansia sp. RSA 1721]KAJ2639346.1 hypothetical protein GGF40_000904 [Coemansia sp. RSA 1286]